MRLERQPDYWELRGSKREADMALAQLVAEVDSIGTHADQSVARLPTTPRLVAEGMHVRSCGRATLTGSSEWSLGPRRLGRRRSGRGR
jgi:hypothetical protein